MVLPMRSIDTPDRMNSGSHTAHSVLPSHLLEHNHDIPHFNAIVFHKFVPSLDRFPIRQGCIRRSQVVEIKLLAIALDFGLLAPRRRCLAGYSRELLGAAKADIAVAIAWIGADALGGGLRITSVFTRPSSQNTPLPGRWPDRVQPG